MAISVQGLRRSYGAFTAVDDLSFEVRGGEIVGLIGPNGAGKTTTLRTLAGILKPTAGRVIVDGHDVVQAPIEALFRTDLDLKRSGGDPRVLLERLVVELCTWKRGRALGRF